MGCFSCFGSSEKEVNKSSKEASKKDFVKEGSKGQSNSIVNTLNSANLVCALPGFPVLANYKIYEGYVINEDKSRSQDGKDSKKEMTVTKHPARIFTFEELSVATKYFRPEFLLGEGGFGRVFKGQLDTGETVAVKQLDRHGDQGSREFSVEILMLSLLHHPNLIRLIGHCSQGSQRLLVYEFMPLGSLEDHLHG
ncbi:hypothetical protein SASPL_103735 [Salvia splendens]|uniref:non-specific serine/threonine protein kinase n=1 Tax=Salvia splendens TaxID=180675 RepID=A0A8X9A956_SALSN|nr:hypothetical protein SASPL_103735 [Salvia splendens]